MLANEAGLIKIIKPSDRRIEIIIIYLQVPSIETCGFDTPFIFTSTVNS